LSRPLEELLHPEDRARVLGNYEKRLRREPTENNYTFRTFPRAGASRSLQINAVAIDWEGHPATLSFVSDVTDRVRLHQNLRQTLSEREAILETAEVGIVFIQYGVMRWINSMLETQMLGYQKGELIGKRGEIVFLSHEAWAKVITECVPLFEEGKRYRTEMQLQRNDGSIFWCDFSGKAINHRDLNQGSIWAVMDITERRRLQEELNRTLSEREAVLQNTLVGITLSMARRHHWLNKRMADMLGYKPEELIGQLSRIHFPDQESWERFGEVAYPILETGQSYSTELQMRRKDGTLIWCEVQGTGINPQDLSHGTIWTFTDISELKRAEEEMRNALAKEKELSELKSRFVSMTSHEFRTPLATILSATEMLEQYAERLLPPEKSELMGLIKTAVKNMTHMLDDVLTVGRADSGRLEFNPQPLDIRAYCGSLAEELRRSLDPKHELIFTSSGDAPIALVDDKLLRQILGNLLTNAIKFSPQGGKVGFHLESRNGELRFEITDQGIGISLEDQAHLFETFHRGKNVSNISGTGLGLAIVQKCLDLHGGEISIESELSCGSRFTVTIPAAVPSK